MKQPSVTDMRDDPSPLLAPATRSPPSAEDLDVSAPPSSSLDDIFSPAPGEHSDVSRLRSQHVTAGYRDGIASSKGLHVQAGFDEGYPLGAALGYFSARLIGVLEGLLAAGASISQDLVQNARKELAVDGLISREWFDEDGVWTYEVDGEGWEDIAEAHPVLRVWERRVYDVMKDCGMTVAQPGAQEDLEHEVNG